MSLIWLLPIRGRHRKKPPRPTKWAQTRLGVEPLEERTLLSVGVGLSVRNGVATLTVNDNAANHVGVEKPDGVYRFSVDSGVLQTQPWQTVTSIVVTTAGGDDVVIVGQSVPVKVTVKSGSGNDGVYGYGPGQLIVYAGAGNDVLEGMAGNDKLYGEGNADTIYTGAGFDYVNGGSGCDTYYVTPGQDRWVAQRCDTVNRVDPTDVAPPWTTQNGTLTVDWRQEASGAVIHATGPSSWEIQWNGSTWVLTGISHFVFHGSAYSDFVDGTLFAGTTEMYGNGSGDTLRGGSNRDVLFGGAGNDLLYGNAGNDDLTGNAGNDLHDGGTGADLLDAIDGTFGNDPLVFDLLDTVLRDPGGVSVIDTIDDVTGHAVYQGTTVAMVEVDLGVSGIFYSLSINGAVRPLNPRRANGVIDVYVADTLSNFTIDVGLRLDLEAQGWLQVHVVPGGGGDPNYG